MAISFLLLWLDNLRLLNFPKNWLAGITMPIQFGVYRAYQGVGNTFSFLTFWKSGYSQIAYLKQRNAQLLVTAQKVKELTEENQFLKSQLAQTPELAPSLLPAEVVGYQRFLILNKGSLDKVKTGETVLVNDFLVGKIKKTEEHQSQVTVLTDPNSKIPVISSNNNSKGILQGTFGTGLILTNVLQGDTLDLEEILKTWGDEDYPANLLVGKISGIESQESALFKTARVTPLIDYNKLTTVFILVN